MLEIHATKKALEDLENIWIYSFINHGEKQANKYLKELDASLNKILLKNPKIGIKCNHIRAGYRKYQINKHLIFYKLTTKRIYIIRILHKRMESKRHFS